jgi:hypothetical protein
VQGENSEHRAQITCSFVTRRSKVKHTGVEQVVWAMCSCNIHSDYRFYLSEKEEGHQLRMRREEWVVEICKEKGMSELFDFSHCDFYRKLSRAPLRGHWHCVLTLKSVLCFLNQLLLCLRLHCLCCL